MARLFISHSSANNAAAFALCKFLSEMGYDDVFLDVDPDRGLVAGDRWQEALKSAADRCQAILYLISPEWLDSRWCLAEFLLGKALHKRIFGLLVEPVAIERMPVEMSAEWQICDLTGDDRGRKFTIDLNGKPVDVSFAERGLTSLQRGLARSGLDARSFPWPPPSEPGRPPYRGLRALEAEDAAIFFGREAHLVRALDRIRGLAQDGVQKMMVILGASGSGKSSFLRAGVLPRLARDDLLFLPLPVIRPETAAMNGAAGFVAAIATAFNRLGAPLAPGRIKERLSRGELRRLFGELVDCAASRNVQADGATPTPTIVIAIDQAEELFNSEGADEASRFLAALAELAQTSGEFAQVRTVTLIAIRSDRYELLQAFPTISETKRDLFDLPPLPASEYKSVIEGPAARVVAAGGRLVIDPDLTERLIAEASGADALPLLSFTLERLYADYGADGRLTLEEYVALGGVQGSIEETISLALADPGRTPTIPTAREEQYARMRAAFIPWLARLAPDIGVPMRRVARLDEIPEASRAITDRLVAARLLVVDRRAGADVIEVAHESLLRRWPALAGWLEADAVDLKMVDGVERAAAEWDRNGRSEAWLDHRGERLASAERLVARPDFRKRMGSEGEDYLGACHKREQAERLEKQTALEREQSRLAEVAAAQTRTARNQRIARWSLAAVALAIAVALAVGVSQRRTNLRLEASLQAQAANLQRAQINLFVELATLERLQGAVDTAMRFAVYAVTLERDRSGDAHAASAAREELATEVSEDNWRLSVRGGTRSVSSAAFSPDGARFVTASQDGLARVWNAADGKLLFTLRGHAAGLMSAQYSPDGSKIVTASEDQTARLWDARTGEPIGVLSGHSNKVTSATFSPDGSKIVTSSFDQTARLWDAATLQQIATFSGHQNTVQSASFSPDGAKLVTASDDSTARIWDVATAHQLVVLTGHDKAVYSAAFSPDGLRVVTGSDDNTARVWVAETGAQVGNLRGDTDYINDAVYSPDGSMILTASGDRTARLWDAKTYAQIASLNGHEDYLNSARFDPKGDAVVTASRDGTARIWPMDTAGAARKFAGHSDGVIAVAFSPDGARLATASSDMTARIRSVGDSKPDLTLVGHFAALRSIAFSPDGRRVLTGSEDRTARIWNAETGAEMVKLQGHGNWVLSAVFSPDGTRVATASWDKTARIWDAASGRQLQVIPLTDVVWSVAFSPDGARLATGSQDGLAQIWDLATENRQLSLKGHDGPVYSVAFSPDGSRLLTASQDRTARLWNAATGAETLEFRGHDSAVLSAAFSRDGARVLTGGADHTARIWNAADGVQIAILSGSTDAVPSAVFSPDGKQAAIGSKDHLAYMWRAEQVERSIADLIADACANRLGPLSAMTHDDMALGGFDPQATPIDVCAAAAPNSRAPL